MRSNVVLTVIVSDEVLVFDHVWILTLRLIRVVGIYKEMFFELLSHSTGVS